MTAVRAYVAGRLAGQLDASFINQDLGLALNTTAVKRAARDVHWRPPGYTNPGSPTGVASPGSGTALRDWLAIRAHELDLGLGLVTFPVTSGQAQRQLYLGLSKVDGVVQVLAVGDGRYRRVVALVLTDGEGDRRRIRAELDEFGDGWRWDEVDEETVEPAVGTWRHLACAAAQREDLLDR